MGLPILFPDIHRLVSLGIRKLFVNFSNFNLVGQFENGKQVVISLENSYEVDVLIFEQKMPVKDAFSCCFTLSG